MMRAVPQLHVLVVDDEPRIRDVVRYALEREGYRVTAADALGSATTSMQADPPDLLVLDVMLPDGSGLELCRRLRRHAATPILFLSARSEEIDRVIGLEVGADDYLTKPFSPRELVARVRAVLRRARPDGWGKPTEPQDDGKESPRPESGRPPLRFGPLSVDPERHEVRVGTDLVRLTPTEFSILHSLLVRPGIVLSRQQLLDAATGDGVHVAERTVDTHVRRIRNKLRERGVAPIETVHGVGYKIREEPPGDRE